MKVVDLTLPMYTGMPVYPGDPEVSIELIKTVDKEGWNMRRLEINSHDCTHVNVPVHAVNGGKTLDDYSVENFFGSAHIYDGEITPNAGVIFREQNIDEEIAEEIKRIKPPFVGLSGGYVFVEEIENDLLQHEIISYENLVKLGGLSGKFMFYGLPLKIKEGDGSPVRAFAVLE